MKNFTVVIPSVDEILNSYVNGEFKLYEYFDQSSSRKFRFYLMYLFDSPYHWELHGLYTNANIENSTSDLNPMFIFYDVYKKAFNRKNYLNTYELQSILTKFRNFLVSVHSSIKYSRNKDKQHNAFPFTLLSKNYVYSEND